MWGTIQKIENIFSSFCFVPITNKLYVLVGGGGGGGGGRVEGYYFHVVQPSVCPFTSCLKLPCLRSNVP